MANQFPDARRYITSRSESTETSDKTHRASLVVIPPDTLSEPIQAIRRKHDRKVGRWMPHMNIVYPFRPRRNFGMAARLTEEACARIEPFEITLGSFGTFDHGSSHTMWLDPQPREPLVELHRVLAEQFPDCDETGRFETGFTPHLSVGQTQTKAEAEELIAGFTAAWEPIVFVVDAVALIWRSRQTDDIFRVDRTIALGGAAPSQPTI